MWTKNFSQRSPWLVWKTLTNLSPWKVTWVCWSGDYRPQMNLSFHWQVSPEHLVLVLPIKLTAYVSPVVSYDLCSSNFCLFCLYSKLLALWEWYRLWCKHRVWATGWISGTQWCSCLYSCTVSRSSLDLVQDNNSFTLYTFIGILMYLLRCPMCNIASWGHLVCYLHFSIETISSQVRSRSSCDWWSRWRISPWQQTKCPGVVSARDWCKE